MTWPGPRARCSSTPGATVGRCGSPGITSPTWSSSPCGATVRAPSTFRLSKEDVNEFIDALIDGLRDAPGVQVASPGSHRAPVVDRAELPEPHQPAETGHQTFPEFSDGDDETADEASSPFTEWAFGGQANAS